MAEERNEALGLCPRPVDVMYSSGRCGLEEVCPHQNTLVVEELAVNGILQSANE